MLTVKNQAQGKVLHNERSFGLTPTDLSTFLNSFQLIGIQSDDFKIPIYDIVDRVIDGFASSYRLATLLVSPYPSCKQ